MQRITPTAYDPFLNLHPPPECCEKTRRSLLKGGSIYDNDVF